uniref:Uncharacterized protein n=1 Tax=Arundo donax TaxID=35708 RepID=A0A0A9HPZ5_ARUDO
MCAGDRGRGTVG